MRVKALAPFSAASIHWLNGQGQLVTTVVVKATFDLVPIEATVARPEPVRRADEPHDGDPNASLRAASELAPFKPRADVIVVGSAYASRGEPVKSLVARVIVADVDKAIEVWGDRTFGADGELRSVQRFAQMPLRYERAGGGPGTSNPFGAPPGRADARGQSCLPNLQQPGLNVTAATTTLEPTGFGPLGPDAWQRRERLGARGWSAEGSHPLPDDFDAAYFNVAPVDQQSAVLREDERIVLENLHREHPRLVTSLPGIKPRAFAERGGSVYAFRLTCDTLIIDTDRATATLVWRGHVPIGADDHARVMIAPERPGAPPLAWADVARAIEAEKGLESHTLLDEAPRRAGAPLPFAVGSRAMMGSATNEAPARRRALGPDDEDAAGTIATTTAAIPGAAPAWLARGGAPPAPAASPPPAVYRAPPADVAAPRDAWTGSANAAWTPQPARVDGRGPTGSVVDTAAAAFTGALAASDAAANVEPPRASAADSRAAPLPPTAAVVAPPPKPGRQHVQLLGHESSALPRIRAAFAAILKPAGDDDDWIKPADVVNAASQESVDRADLRKILRSDAHVDGLAVAKLLEDDDVDEAPIALVHGDVELLFDEVEALRTLLSIVGPLAFGDKKLKELVDLAAEVLGGRWGTTPSVAEGLSMRLREAFPSVQRTLPREHLDTASTAALLERRHFKRHVVLGQKHVRAALTVVNHAAPVPLYIPEAFADRLPMFQRFRVVAVAEITLPQDQRDTTPWSLRALALARRG